MAIITLLTDFGLRDHYVGVMKGVIAGIAPEAQVIDITHEVEPFQIAQGAYLLAQSWNWFPRGTIHVAVVDPGVGSARRAIAAEHEGRYFVLPDNGLLPFADVVREIRSGVPASTTFHGRDIFAPAAAHLAAGTPFEKMGPLAEDWLRPPATREQVLHIDRFGNVITSLRTAHAVAIRGFRIDLHASNYSAAPRGELFLITGSGGYLEISEREASAAVRLRCRVGDPVKAIEKS
jgi:S-adenosylmethionine hydrolase